LISISDNILIGPMFQFHLICPQTDRESIAEDGRRLDELNQSHDMILF